MTTAIKAEARRLVDQLPDDATWEDLMERIYVRQVIEAGLEDCRVGRVASMDEVKQEFGMTQ